MLQFLQDHVLPDGVSAVALHAVEWLTASVDCESTGVVTIANSKTDYVFLLESGRQMLMGLQEGPDREGRVTADMLKLLLPRIIMLFETKTTKGLGSGEGPMHQAVLEYLAVNKLRAWTSGGFFRRWMGLIDATNWAEVGATDCISIPRKLTLCLYLCEEFRGGARQAGAVDAMIAAARAPPTRRQDPRPDGRLQQVVVHSCRRERQRDP